MYFNLGSHHLIYRFVLRECWQVVGDGPPDIGLWSPREDHKMEVEVSHSLDKLVFEKIVEGPGLHRVLGCRAHRELAIQNDQCLAS